MRVLAPILAALAAFPAACFGEAGKAASSGYPHAASKKGLQVELLDDALALEIKHAAMNVNLAQLVAPNADAVGDDYLRWTMSGRAYYFHRGRVEQLDQKIRTLTSHGVVNHLILLVYEAGDSAVNRIMLHPAYDAAAPNKLSAFNSRTAEGRNWLAATMEFLAERYSRTDLKHGRVAGYILGNEVNSHWWWSNMGRATMQEFTDDYWAALQLVHQAVRRHSPWARVYVPLDHHWSIRYPAGDDRQAFAGKEFLDELVRRGQKDAASDLDWHVAYHPYPENLFEPRFWNDSTALPNPQTPRITFKNLEVLTEYLRRPEFLHRGEPRRVILSEQGFHTPEGPAGEAIQAAAFCYAFRKVAKLDGVDAFILHRHVDHPNEGGLRLGLRRYLPHEADPRPEKQIYQCFRRADAPDWQSAFEFALPIIGIAQWAEVED